MRAVAFSSRLRVFACDKFDPAFDYTKCVTMTLAAREGSRLDRYGG
jgi:hypothetical protein